MEKAAVVETFEGFEASVTALAANVRTAAGSEAGGVTAAGVDAVQGDDPLWDQADAFLDGLAEVAGLEARLAALKVHLTAGYAAAARAVAGPVRSPQERMTREMAVTAEVACVLTLSERAADALLCQARALTARLPLTLAALGAGGISWQHARVLCDETTDLEPAAAAALEAHFLDPCAPSAARGGPAGELVPGRFRARVRAWRERHHPVSIETRHRKSAADRRVEYAPDRDGMAWLSAYLPADTAAGIWNRATAAARGLQGPGECRTLTQLRADAAAGWLLAGVAEGIPSPKAQVLVTVPVVSLLGAGAEPAVLDGYGPVPASMARRLVADGAASFLRVLTDPRDGAPLEIGRTSYRLTKPMRQWLRLRDGRCPFPGCSNQSLDNEADHLLAWSAGGGTGIANLGQPCPKHHRLRHTTPWRPVNATRHSPPGWISPAGRYYPSEQQDWEPPHWPKIPKEPDSLKETDHPNWPDHPEEPDSLKEPDNREEPDSPNWLDSLEEPPCFDWQANFEGLDPPPPAGPLPADPFADWEAIAAG